MQKNTQRQRLRRLDPVWFRLLIRTPFDVEFPSAQFHVELSQCIAGSWDWTLEAHNARSGGHIDLTERFKDPGALARALYEDGFASRYATLAETILLKLVREGRAEKLAAPLRPPTPQNGWPWMWP